MGWSYYKKNRRHMDEKDLGVDSKRGETFSRKTSKKMGGRDCGKDESAEKSVGYGSGKRNGKSRTAPSAKPINIMDDVSEATKQMEEMLGPARLNSEKWLEWLLRMFPHYPDAKCSYTVDVETKLTEKHEAYRKDLAQKKLDPATYGDLRGSKSLFKLTYDCSLENYAKGVIKSDCKRDLTDLSKIGKGVNYIRYTVLADPNAALHTHFESAVDQWAEVESPLSKDAVFRDEKHLPFANIINYKTLKFGCGAKWCDASKQLALACVYSSAPVIGEVLYLNNSNADTGCSDDSTCKKVVKKDGACDKPTGLCTTTADTIDTTTAATTTTTATTTPQSTSSAPASPESSSASPQTTPSQASEGMTQEIRTRIIGMHNWRRSELAKGNVRNGKVGKANFKTAMNIYEMIYDMSLEMNAQNYANTCPGGGSAVSGSGQNIYVAASQTTPYLNVAVEGIKSWWRKIFSVGINYRMLYTQNIEMKTNAPIEFTQMAWATTYKVGCGLNRCPFGTIFVCRYSPRGNNYNQYIYQVGSLCGSCATSCNNGLCRVP